MSDLVKLSIDGREVEVAAGSTLLEAASQAGISIPTLCHLKGKPHQTSCFVCMVRVIGVTRLLPSCATRAENGMQVQSETDEVREARRKAIELLLSDHLGDCIAPCQLMCPSRLDIAAMNRAILAEDWTAAIAVARDGLVLPATLGRVCPVLCERGCRRRAADGAVSICELHRTAADLDLAKPEPWLPAKAPTTGKKVAIIGAGPAGLAAAYHLLKMGHDCTVFEAKDVAGGLLRTEIPDDRLPKSVLDQEIAAVERLGAKFEYGIKANPTELKTMFDAVVIATGELKEALEGFETGPKGVKVDPHTYATNIEGIFAAGASMHPTKHAVTSVANGKAAAEGVHKYLAHAEKEWWHDLYTSQVGRLDKEEVQQYLLHANPGHRHETIDEKSAKDEAARCLHCDCRKLRDCRLRLVALQYNAKQERFKGERLPMIVDGSHFDVVFEPGKCISCGLCVQIARDAGVPFGLTFVGRGFGVKPAPPFGVSLEQALGPVARECAAACPTAALAIKEWCKDGNGL